MKEWLTYLSSDELQGRQVFTEGYGLAAQYIADHLQAVGREAARRRRHLLPEREAEGLQGHAQLDGDRRGQRPDQTFKHGDHVTFGANSGGKQTLTFNGAEFVGYGRERGATTTTSRAATSRTSSSCWMPGTPARSPSAAAGGGGRGGRAGAAAAAYAIGTLARRRRRLCGGAGAADGGRRGAHEGAGGAHAGGRRRDAGAAGAQAQRRARGRGGAAFGGGGGAADAASRDRDADITTVLEGRQHRAAAVHRRRDVLRVLFSGGPVKFADLKAKARRRASRCRRCR